MAKDKSKPEPIPPGVYNMTIDRVRKIRNKDAYRIHAHLDDGTPITNVLKVKP